MPDPAQPPAGAAPLGAKEFFDRVDADPNMRAAVHAANDTIVTLAASHGYVFTYQEMQLHLRERWDVRNSPLDYCCT